MFPISNIFHPEFDSFQSSYIHKLAVVNKGPHEVPLYFHGYLLSNHAVYCMRPSLINLHTYTRSTYPPGIRNNWPASIVVELLEGNQKLIVHYTTWWLAYPCAIVHCSCGPTLGFPSVSRLLRTSPPLHQTPLFNLLLIHTSTKQHFRYLIRPSSPDKGVKKLEGKKTVAIFSITKIPRITADSKSSPLLYFGAL